MYKLSVPVMNVSLNERSREEYLRYLQGAKIERVFLVIFGFGSDGAEEDRTIKSLRQNAAFLEENGIETGVWIGATIGHGSALAARAVPMRTEAPTLR